MRAADEKLIINKLGPYNAGAFFCRSFNLIYVALAAMDSDVIPLTIPSGFNPMITRAFVIYTGRTSSATMPMGIFDYVIISALANILFSVF